jgi:hypothetical protein
VSHKLWALLASSTALQVVHWVRPCSVQHVQWWQMTPVQQQPRQLQVRTADLALQ